MPDETNNIGGRVLSLENDVVNIGRTLQSISDKIDINQSRNDARFQTFQDNQLAQAQTRSAGAWQVLASLGTGVLSLAGLAVALYTLTKEPITDKFQRDERDIFQLQANTVPKDQVNDIEKKADKNIDRLNEAEKLLAAVQANQQNDQRSIEGLTKRQDEIATKYALNSRVDLLSTRVQTIFDKNFALPSFSTLSGVAATPREK